VIGYFFARVGDIFKRAPTQEVGFDVYVGEAPYPRYCGCRESFSVPVLTGIRCYAPGEDQRVVINFRTPLTVIYGANGTGKTVRNYCKHYLLHKHGTDHH